MGWVVLSTCAPSPEPEPDDAAGAPPIDGQGFPSGPGHDAEFVGAYDGRGPFLDLEVRADGSWGGFCVAGGSYDGCLTVEGNGYVGGRWSPEAEGLRLSVEETAGVPFGARLEGAHVVLEDDALVVTPLDGDPFRVARRTEDGDR